MKASLRLAVATGVVGAALLTVAWHKPRNGAVRVLASARGSPRRCRAPIPSLDRHRSHSRCARVHRRRTAHGGLGARPRARRVGSRHLPRRRSRGRRDQHARGTAAVAAGDVGRNDCAATVARRRCARAGIRGDPFTTSDADRDSVSRLLGIGRHHRAGRLRRQRSARRLRLARGAGASTCAERSRSSATRCLTAIVASKRLPPSGAAPPASSSTPILRTTASRRARPYPDGPWGPESRIERGGIAYDFLVPGDPLTPGWASIDGARRSHARTRSRCRRSSAHRSPSMTRA